MKNKERFKNWTSPEFIKKEGLKCWENKYGWRVWANFNNFVLGHCVDIGTGTELFAHDQLIIADFVEIGAHCIIYTKNTINDVKGPVLIKEGAKIGAQTLILPGVVVEKGEFIKAKSIVYINKKGKRKIL